MRAASTTYTLWDLEDANLIGTYASESAALEIVRLSVETHGQDSMLGVGLGKEDEFGKTVAVAEGAGLIDLAKRE